MKKRLNKNLWLQMTVFLALALSTNLLAPSPARADETTAETSANIEESSKFVPAPVLQGASPSMPFKMDAAPPLYGETNGTIGPPGSDATAIMMDPDSSRQPAGTPVSAVLLLSLAASTIAVSFRWLKKENKNAIWLYGLAAASVLMVAGFIWGNRL